MTSKRDFLVLSDIHLGHNGTPTDHITKNLEVFLGFNEKHLKFPGLRLIIISGDLWDKSVQLGADFIPEFMVFWFRFCQWCIRHKLSVRLLKGTPRHDGNQGSTVESITKTSFPSLDFRYYSELTIDHEDELALDILYVPDEIRGSALITYRDVTALLNERGLASVDIAVMHGMFAFQLGTIPLNHKVHREEDYLRITKGPIVIGHIHKASQCERIYAPGSFDRLSHNEEEPKGGYLFKEVEVGHWLPVFIENTGAKRYITVAIPDDIQESYVLLDKVVPKLPRMSAVRLLLSPGHPILSGLENLTKRFPEVRITIKFTTVTKTKEESLSQISHAALVLSKTTLDEAIVDEIRRNTQLTPEDESLLASLLHKLHR